MIKRIIDIVGSVTGIVVLLPVGLLVAFLVRTHDGGRVFYKARRLGMHGNVFHLFKFRSMVTNADTLGPGITGSNDPRITPIGVFLRRTKLDEIPQLWNVLKGEMSLVGPRPEAPKFLPYYSDRQKAILSVRPGITSPSSLVFSNIEEDLSTETAEEDYALRLLPVKLDLDLRYINDQSGFYDLTILFKTVFRIFRLHSGDSSGTSSSFQTSPSP